MAEPQGGDLVYRHRASTRIWHWLNALTVFVMLMSGLMIFNAHPRLYWGEYGANADRAWLQIGGNRERGFVRIGSLEIPTTGVLGHWRDADGNISTRAFPGWATIPTSYDLAGARALAFPVRLAAGRPRPRSTGCGASSTATSSATSRPARASCRRATSGTTSRTTPACASRPGAAARDYNILQKAAYLGVLFVLLPLIVLTGLTMSPGMDAAWPWLLDLFGGRQSARSIHFIAAAADRRASSSSTGRWWCWPGRSTRSAR